MTEPVAENPPTPKKVEPKARPTTIVLPETGKPESAPTEVPIALQFTSAAAERLKKAFGTRPSSCVIVEVDVAANCKGFNYGLRLGFPTPPEKYVVGRSFGIKIAFEKRHEEFLSGTTIDWGSRVAGGPTGFMFKNPSENPMLLPEYKEMAARKAEEWHRDKERAALVDPAEAIAMLTTGPSQYAFDALRLYNRYFGPRREEKPPEWNPVMAYLDGRDRKLTHLVKCPTGTGSTILAAFHDGEEERPVGGFMLFGADGVEVPVHGNANHVGEDDAFVDANGDGVFDLCTTSPTGIRSESEDRTYVGTCEKFVVASVLREPSVLLTVVFDPRAGLSDSEWRCRLVPAEGRFDVVLEREEESAATEAARYRWSSKDGRYIGPESGPGFVATAGDVPYDRVLEFWRSRTGK